MSDVVSRADRFQRRHRVIGFPLGVLYKFFPNKQAIVEALALRYIE